MIVEVGAMDRASPYSSGSRRVLLLNFIVTTLESNPPSRCFRTDVSRRFLLLTRTERRLLEGGDGIYLEDFDFDDFLHW